MNDDSRRRRRDEAGVGPDPHDTRHLVPLDELRGYRVADGFEDVRGWEVWSSTGRRLGDVDELLVDPTVREVVLLSIDLADRARQVSVPIRAAWVDRDAKRVIIDAAELQKLNDVSSLRREDRDELLEDFTPRASGDAEAPIARGSAPADLPAGTSPPVVEEVVVRRRILSPDEQATAAEEQSPESPPGDRRA